MGKVDTTYMVGHSMGGGITLATIENFGKNYNGGLPFVSIVQQAIPASEARV